MQRVKNTCIIVIQFVLCRMTNEVNLQHVSEQQTTRTYIRNICFVAQVLRFKGKERWHGYVRQARLLFMRLPQSLDPKLQHFTVLKTPILVKSKNFQVTNCSLEFIYILKLSTVWIHFPFGMYKLFSIFLSEACTTSKKAKK